jgi:Ca-activated chloride channel family protein
MPGELVFTSTLHRPVYQAMTTPQQAYVLLEIMPSNAPPGGSAQAINLCLVLDRSGSMAGEKLHYLKEAAKLVVDRLNPQDMLSIVIFDDINPADLVWPCSATVDKERVKRKIDAIQERGGTHMSTGLRLGLQQLRQGQADQRVSSMWLLTDGQTWEDQQDCRNLADECQKAGLPIVVLGMGVGAESNWDPRFLEDLAQRSGGEWAVIDSPEKISAVFADTLRSVKGTTITNAHLTLRLAQGATPRAVWRVNPLISRLGHQEISPYDVQAFLGDLQQGIGQSILADVLFPPRQAGAFRMLQAEINYDVPTSGIHGQKVSQDIIVQFTDDGSIANQVDARIMNIIERVVAHRLQTQALDEAAVGEAAKATQRLRAAATRLLELGETEMSQQAEQQAQQIEQNGQIDLASAQKMRFATKRLTERESYQP